MVFSATDFHQEPTRKTHLYKVHETLSEPKKDILLKMMVLSDKEGFRVELCREYSVDQELSKYKQEIFKPTSRNGETSKRL